MSSFESAGRPRADSIWRPLWRWLWRDSDARYLQTWQKRLDKEKSERLMPRWIGKNAITLPISNDVVSTQIIYAIQVVDNMVWVASGDHLSEIKCDNHHEAETVRDNIARFIGAVRRNFDVY